MKLQELYSELSRQLQDIYSKRKELETRKQADLAPHREKCQEIVDSYKEEISTLIVAEQELRSQVADLYKKSQEIFKSCYKRMEEAQKAGDMEAVQKATLEAESGQLKTNGKVFFRNDYDMVIDNLEEIPKEYLTVDWKKVGKDDVPGIKKVLKPTVVVKE